MYSETVFLSANAQPTSNCKFWITQLKQKLRLFSWAHEKELVFYEEENFRTRAKLFWNEGPKAVVLFLSSRWHQGLK